MLTLVTRETTLPPQAGKVCRPRLSGSDVVVLAYAIIATAFGWGLTGGAGIGLPVTLSR